MRKISVIVALMTALTVATASNSTDSSLFAIAAVGSLAAVSIVGMATYIFSNGDSGYVNPAERIWNGEASWNAFSSSWENLDKAGYLKAVTPDFTFDVEYNPYTPTNGAEASWAFRQQLPNATDANYLLWTNTFDSWMFDENDENILHTKMTTFLRGDCSPQSHPGYCLDTYPAGSVYQMGRWTATIDKPSGKLKAISQKVIFALWTNEWK